MYKSFAWRRMKRIKWADRVSNDQVLNRIGKTEYFWYNRKEAVKEIGHINRKECYQLCLMAQ